MEALFKKYFWVIKALGIATACGLAASAVTTQIGAGLLFDAAEESQGEGEGDSDGEDSDGEDDDETKGRTGSAAFAPSSLRQTTPTSQAKAKQHVGEQVLRRNIFCPSCVPEVEEIEPEAAAVDALGRPTGPLIQPGETKSRLPLRLMATMEAEDPEHSFATILDEEVGVAGLFGRNDVIREGVIVMSVDQGLVHLRNNAALEYIELGDVPPPQTAKPKAPTTASEPPKPSSRAIEGAEEAINCPNENTCTVDRAFVDKLMANPVLLAKQARIVPKQKDDEVLGYKLYGIRRDSLPRLLGLKNGDMLTAVNGEQLGSMDQAMALYGKLRRASNLSVSIERKGQTITKEIQIQ